MPHLGQRVTAATAPGVAARRRGACERGHGGKGQCARLQGLEVHLVRVRAGVRVGDRVGVKV